MTKQQVQDSKEDQPDINSDKIDERIAAKQQKLKSINAGLQVYMEKQYSMKVKQDVDNLQHKLEYRLKKLEEKGLDTKIEIFSKVLKTIKNAGKN